MPYDSISDLPDAVKELPKKKQRQWMAAWNSSHEAGDDEETSFAKAWGAVKEDNSATEARAFQHEFTKNGVLVDLGWAGWFHLYDYFTTGADSPFRGRELTDDEFVAELVEIASDDSGDSVFLRPMPVKTSAENYFVKPDRVKSEFGALRRRWDRLRSVAKDATSALGKGGFSRKRMPVVLSGLADVKLGTTGAGGSSETGGFYNHYKHCILIDDTSFSGDRLPEVFGHEWAHKFIKEAPKDVKDRLRRWFSENLVPPRKTEPGEFFPDRMKRTLVNDVKGLMLRDGDFAPVYRALSAITGTLHSHPGYDPREGPYGDDAPGGYLVPEVDTFIKHEDGIDDFGDVADFIGRHVWDSGDDALKGFYRDARERVDAELRDSIDKLDDRPHPFRKVGTKRWNRLSPRPEDLDPDKVFPSEDEFVRAFRSAASAVINLAGKAVRRAESLGFREPFASFLAHRLNRYFDFSGMSPQPHLAGGKWNKLRRKLKKRGLVPDDYSAVNWNELFATMVEFLAFGRGTGADEDLTSMVRDVIESEERDAAAVGSDAGVVRPVTFADLGLGDDSDDGAPEETVAPRVRGIPLEESRDYEFSCVMAPLPGGLAEKVERYAGLVPDEDLYEGEGFGRADDPHVTLKFGLITRDSGEAARALRGVRPFAASLGRTFRFEGDEFDVIAAEARGEGLLVCHSLLSRLRNGDPHEDYVPHCTVAFVKPGACSWLDGDDALAGEGFTVRDVVFSDREGNEETFSLGAAQAAVSSVERESDAKPARHREFAQKLARDFFRERIAGGGEWIEEIVRRLREGEGLSRGMLYGGDPRRPGDLRDQYHEWAEENVDPADLDVALAVSDDVLFDAVKFIGTMDARAAEVLVRGNISGDFVFEAVSGLGALGSERLREGGFLLRFGNAELAKRAEDILTSAGLDARSW